MHETSEFPHLPITISLCMIVKNEEAVLSRCLQSTLDIVDEYIIVDTGSTDRTKEIAAEFAETVYTFPWIDDFAAARNFAFEQATKEYILWLDADDIILPEDRKKFLELKRSLPDAVDSVSMPYHLTFNAAGQVTSQLRRNRLVKRTNNYRWTGAVHEYLQVAGHIINSDIAITHYPLEHDANRNLRIYEERQKRGDTFSPRDLYYFANELFDHRLYNRAIEYYQRFLATKAGWVEDNIAACGKLSDCFYHLKETASQLSSIFRSFEYDSPRADFCCRLGFFYLQQNNLPQAIFWYDLATRLEKPAAAWGLMNEDCWTWLPHLQLCVCYYRMGDYRRSHEHNEKAAAFIPGDPRIQINRDLLAKLL